MPHNLVVLFLTSVYSVIIGLIWLWCMDNTH